MANYKPVRIVVPTADINGASGGILNKTLSTTTWKLMVLWGSAVDPNNARLISGGVLIWISNTATGVPDYETFADDKAFFSITLPVAHSYSLKYIEKGN